MQKKSFGMFGGKEKTVKLLVDNRLAGVIIDRFEKTLCSYQQTKIISP